MQQDDFSTMTVELGAGSDHIPTLRLRPVGRTEPTVELKAGADHIPTPRLRPVGRTEPTVELKRPPTGVRVPDRTLELGERDIELMAPPPPPPSTLRKAFGDDIDEDIFAFLGDSPPLAVADDLDTSERGLRAFFRRFFFRLGWIRFEDTQLASPLAGPLS